jgi:Tol biopolymer transport system component
MDLSSGPAHAVAAAQVSAAGGTVSAGLARPAGQNAELRVVYARSATRVVGWPSVVPTLTPRVGSTGEVSVITGSRRVQRRVLIQRASKLSTWQTYKKKVTDRRGHVRVKLLAPTAGPWKFRIVVRATQKARRVSTAPLNATAIPEGARPHLSDLAFSRDNATLVYTREVAASSDVRVMDTATQRVRVVSVDAAGGTANGRSFHPAISPDGTRVAFWSDATNLVPGPDQNHASDLFIKNLTTGAIARVDTGPWGTQQGGFGTTDDRPEFSPDGTRLVFSASRYYLYEVTVATGEVRSLVSVGCSVGSGHYSADGSRIAVQMSQYGEAPNLNWHSYSVEVTTGQTTTVSAKPDGQALFDNAWHGIDTYSEGFLPDNRHYLMRVYSFLGDGPEGLYVKDTTTGAVVRRIAGSLDPDATSWSDNNRFAVVRTSTGLRRIDLLNGATRTVSIGSSPSGRITDMRVANTGSRVALSTWPNSQWALPRLRLVDLSTGAIRSFSGAEQPTFSIDGTMLAVTKGGAVQIIR